MVTLIKLGMLVNYMPPRRSYQQSILRVDVKLQDRVISTLEIGSDVGGSSEGVLHVRSPTWLVEL
jgi:hypothetical protein